MAEVLQTQSVQKYSANPVPFSEHLSELRRRLFFVAITVGVGTALAYSVETQVVNALLKPSHGQHFIYTSPGGGIDFLFRVCFYVGIALAIPVIIYNFLKYIEPAFPVRSARLIYFGTAVSAILAVAGLVFGYFVGLPSAMNFLLHQTVTAQIQPLLTVQSYMSFVVRYMLGSALLFQGPLIIIFINRIKPLKPKTLLKKERWVILIAFIISMLMNPSPNLLSQLIIAGPLIAMYQLSILIIALVNRKSKKDKAVVFYDSEPSSIIQPSSSYEDSRKRAEPMGFPTMALDIKQAQRSTRTSKRPGVRTADGKRLISDFI